MNDEIRRVSVTKNYRLDAGIEERLQAILDRAGNGIKVTKMMEILLREAMDQIEATETPEAIPNQIALVRRQLGKPDYQHPAVTGEIWKEIEAMISRKVEEKVEEKKAPSMGSLPKPTAAGKRAGSNKRSA